MYTEGDSMSYVFLRVSTSFSIIDSAICNLIFLCFMLCFILYILVFVLHCAVVDFLSYLKHVINKIGMVWCKVYTKLV